MLNKLSYSVTFPTTGRTLAGEFEFKPGFGLINGANEQGKSLIIEVVRWCLFGSTGVAWEGRRLQDLEGDPPVLGPRPELCGGSDLHDGEVDAGDVVLCIGTAPVNKHIPALLGFGLDVFDVACAANQGDIERLGNLRPAERKRMVGYGDRPRPPGGGCQMGPGGSSRLRETGRGHRAVSRPRTGQAAGRVRSLRPCVGQGRPRGVATAFEFSMGGKSIEILKEIAPKLARVAVLFNPKTAPYFASFLRSIETGAASVGLPGPQCW